MTNTFYGKYRGIVTNIEDPLHRGRIRAKVPDIFGDNESGWALPCAPFGGDGMGCFCLPKVRAAVWIEFEGGNPDYPIWSGCWWPSQEQMPPVLLSPPYQKLLLKTEAGHSLLLDDTQGTGGITLETADGQKLVLNAQGIELDNGQGAKITLTGLQVSINDGALEVT